MTLFASILKLVSNVRNYLQQTNSADEIFRCIFLVSAFRVNVSVYISGKLKEFNSSIDPNKKLDDSAINGLEGILNGNIPTADNLNVLKSLLEWPPSKYSSAAGLSQKYAVTNDVAVNLLYFYLRGYSKSRSSNGSTPSKIYLSQPPPSMPHPNSFFKFIVFKNHLRRILFAYKGS